ncbi:MAG: sigma 54-interacting transcriptional regulator [Planctomycetota bacterium]
MHIRLTILEGRDLGQTRRFRIERGQQLVLGRHEECDVPLWDEAASRRHALIELIDEAVVITDLGSSNGTFVNEAQIDKRALRSGDRVRIGETHMRLEMEGFQRRETVIIKSDASYTVESSLPLDEVDLGAQLVSDTTRRDRLNHLLRMVDDVQGEEAGERIFRTLLLAGAAALKSEHAAVVPCSSRSREPLWTEVMSSPDGRESDARVSRAIVQQVLNEGNALRVSDPLTDPLTRSRQSIVQRGVASIIAVPIAARDRVHGVLYVEGSASTRTFDEEDLAYAATLGKVAGMALRNAERLQQSRRLLRSKERAQPSEILTESAALRETLQHLARFAASGGPVLVCGETGSGKELLALHAHRSGPYAAGSFLPINCAAIPAALLESELFGHEKGAFTGATGRKAGLFELAHEGTLFLDEIGDLPMELQPKLLRVLETGQFFRVGGGTPVAVSLLLVSATHRDLAEKVTLGEFREDLFFRLNRFRVASPPLRERRPDIVLLARHFLRQACARLGAPELELSAVACEVLTAYGWPGNVRELRNVIERAVVVTRSSSIEPDDLQLSTQSSLRAAAPAADGARPQSLDAMEEQAIRAALRFTGGRKGEAAELLGIAWPTLRRKLKTYRIDADRP